MYINAAQQEPQAVRAPEASGVSAGTLPVAVGRRQWLCTLVALLVLLAGAATALGWVTRGYAAVTSEAVRRIDLQRSPRALPGLALVDQAGRAFSLADYGAESPLSTFVLLAYVRCNAVCAATTSGQAYLQQEIVRRHLQGRLRLLTLSFDPANDTPAVLAAQARKLGARTELWRWATVKQSDALPDLLRLFDLVVIPDGLGGYTHNTALFLVDRHGRLSRAYDATRPDLALADFLRLPEQP